METLSIKGSWKSPHITLNPNGNFEIWGRSLPENVFELYEPVFDWLKEYEKSPAETTNVEVKLEYFNTSSSKLLFEIFKHFEKISKAGNKLNVKWYFEHDDPDLEEEGKMFSDLVDIPVELISVEEFDFTFEI